MSAEGQSGSPGKPARGPRDRDRAPCDDSSVPDPGRRAALKGAVATVAGLGLGMPEVARATAGNLSSGAAGERPERAVAAPQGGGWRPPSAFARQAEVPGFRGSARVVVVGGGWSGLEIARQLRALRPDLEVVLVEKRSMFFSCPLSNLWLVDRLSMDVLTHSYQDAARSNGYAWLHAAVVDVDFERRVVWTDEGWLTYDWLVIAPGIDYDYAPFGVVDPGEVQRLKAHYPAAFKPGSEHLTLKRKLEAFDAGTFVLTAPPGNYRCLPAPYERACMIAAYFRENDIEGRVVLLDPRPEPGFEPDGIRKAFRDLYEGWLEYVPGTQITGIDVDRRRIETSRGAIEFADAAIYPPVRGARLLERLGISDPDNHHFAAIDPVTYHVKGMDRVLVCGDARPMPFVKAGFAANFEASHIARIVTGRMEGRDVEPLKSPGIMCYVAVNAYPLQSIAFKITFGWELDPESGKTRFVQKAQAFPRRSRSLGKANIRWGKGMFQEMFYTPL
jgi:NADPH-dependent 2,4-dienoyl-CoA reductase/sulfur reductase-like enzyme